MKIKYNYLIAGMLIVLASCGKRLADVPTPNIDVSTSSATFKAGDLVNFEINTDANIVAFYSGEPLVDYAFKDGRVIDITGAGLKMSFTSAIAGTGTQGTLSATVPPQLSVMASTNFTGVYDYNTVKAATWTDITSRFKYSTTTTFLASTTVDISDLVVAGKPLYIAYKYTTKPQITNGDGRTWQMESLVLTTNKNVGSTASPILPVITDQVGAGFQIIDQFPATAPSQSAITATRVKLLANLYTPTNDPASETWAVSKAISMSTLDIGRDKSIAIKDLGKSSPLTSYTYSYAVPGTYTATFVASNVNLTSKQEKVKQIQVTITP